MPFERPGQRPKDKPDKAGRLPEKLKKRQGKGIKIDAKEGMELSEDLEKAEKHLKKQYQEIIRWWKKNPDQHNQNAIEKKITQTLNSKLTKAEIAALAESPKYDKGDEIYQEGAPGAVFGWEWKDKNKTEIVGWGAWG